MILRSFGCSLIYGADLSDDDRRDLWPRPSQLTWPALIALHLGLEYHCHARSGSGNLSIMDRLLQASYLWPDDLYVINWSFSDRFDYSDPQGNHFAGNVNDWCTITPTGTNELSQIYYRDMHSEYRDKLTTLTEIYTAVTVLSARGQKFYMTYEDPLILDKRWHASPGITDLQQRVRPYLNDINGQTFIQWSRAQGHEISDNLHPLESAHAAAAEIHGPRIESILRRA